MISQISLTDEQFAAMQAHAMRANPPEVMDVPELALFLGVSQDTVRTKTQLGEIPAKSLGTRILYYRESIREWLRRGQGRRS